jgi:hypothetical protein|tara:strand:+ start:808 stop:1008 length:201 start_codon:yes stop_codon:yes gene_type:complete
MKEETLIQIKNKVERLEQTMQQVIQELYNLKNLSVGTLETIKRMPDYDEALDTLKKDSEKEKEAKE